MGFKHIEHIDQHNSINLNSNIKAHFIHLQVIKISMSNLRDNHLHMKPSICFLHTPCYELNDDRLEPPLGLLYLATVLQNHQYDVSLCDLSSIPKNKWGEYIPSADVYGFSTYTVTYHRTLDILQMVITAHPKAITVAGGPHASALPKSVARNFNYVVVGEGENAIIHLIEELEKKNKDIPHILYKSSQVNPEQLPFPDYSLIDIASYRRICNGQPSLSVLSSRGCPYQCVFCNSRVMHENGNVRFRSPENIVREIREMKQVLGISSFRFLDDTFTLCLNRIRLLTKLLKNEEITYRCFGRVDNCQEEMTNLLYEGGCRHIAFGIESGSPEMLRRMEKHQSVSDIRSGILNAKTSGIVVRVYLMVGFPGETWDSVKQTVDLMKDCAPDEFIVYPMIPYPGTPLFQDPELFGIRNIDPDFSRFVQVGRNRRTGFVFRTDELDEQKIEEMRSYLIEHLEPVSLWAGESQLFR